MNRNRKEGRGEIGDSKITSGSGDRRQNSSRVGNSGIRRDNNRVNVTKVLNESPLTRRLLLDRSCGGIAGASCRNKNTLL